MNSTYLNQIQERLSNSIREADSLASGLNSEQLNWQPATDKWSIAQCYEHMLVGADLYAAKLVPAIKAGRDKGLNADPGLEPRHSFMGKLIIKAVDPQATKPMKSPKTFAPAQSDIESDVNDRFGKSHQVIIDLMSDCDGLNFNKIKMGSPVSGLIRLNAGDAFQIMASHAERHLGQARRVKEASGFPG